MQFTISTITLVASLMATSSAMPLVPRANVCGSTPSGSTSQTPLSTTTSAATAEDCKTLCEANSSCKSFAFGLETGASAPTCELFSVTASQVPAQATNVMIYDVGCADSVVPTTAPTTSNPQGLTTSQEQQQSGSTGSTTGTGSATGSNTSGSTSSNTNGNTSGSTNGNTATANTNGNAQQQQGQH